MKKKILIALCALVAVMAIVAASVLGTIAYMTSASKVSNVFTIGDVLITLDETAVDSHGKPLGNGTTRTDRNSYHLMPGNTYKKDPAITVDAKTETCYLFLVTRNDILTIEANYGLTPAQQKEDENKGSLTMAEQMYANGWAIYKDTSRGSRVWVYCGTEDNIDGRYDATKPNDPNYQYTPMAVCGESVSVANPEFVTQIKQNEPIKIFEKFTITSNSEINIKPFGGAEVTLNAVAIQASSEFGELCSHGAIDKAWAAVIAQYPYIQDNVNQNNVNPTPDSN